MTTKSWDDQRMEIMIGILLRTGVLLAAVLVLSGGIIYLARHGHQIPNYRTFLGEPRGLETVAGILEGAVTWKGQAIIQLGLLVLIATPVVRVAFAVVGFAVEHDYMYVIVSFIVLAVLLYSLFGSS